MFATAVSASPSSLIQARTPFRAGDTSACGTGLRGQIFAHFLVSRTIPNGLVCEHVAEGTPTYIVDALGQAGLAQSFSVDVANSYVIELFGEACGELVQGVFAPVGYLGMDVPRLSLVVRPLSRGEPFLKLPVVARVGNLFASGQGGKVFQSKVNADSSACRSSFRGGNFNNNIQIPIAPSVLVEAGFIQNLASRQRATIENSVSFPINAESITFALQVASAQRNPTKRFLPAPLQIRLGMLRARLSILPASGTDRIGVNPQVFAGAAREVDKVKCGRPFLAPLQRLLLNIVAVVPDKINGFCLLVQKAIQRFNAIFVRQNHAIILS